MELVSVLPLAQREAVLLHYIQQRSIADVAAITGASEGTVKSRLNYARAKLRELVEEKEKKDGVKLHSFGMFLFLPVYLRWFAESVPLSAETAASVLGAAKSTGGGSAAASGSNVSASAAATSGASTIAAASAIVPVAGFSAVISAAGPVLTAAAVTVAVVVAGIGIGIPASLSVDEPLPYQQISATPQREEPSPLLQATPEPTSTPEASPMPTQIAVTIEDFDELFEMLDLLVVDETRNEYGVFVAHTIAKAHELASQGKFTWAMRMINNALRIDAENQHLLGKRDEINAVRTRSLFGLGWREENNFRIWQRDAVVDMQGNAYDTTNIYILDENARFGTHAHFDLDGKYTRLTGELALTKLDNDTRAMVFQIVGDGIVLFEQSFRRTRDSITSEVSVNIDLDITGIEALEITYKRANTQSQTLSRVACVDFVVHQSGSLPQSGALLPISSEPDSSVTLDEWFALYNTLLGKSQETIFGDITTEVIRIAAGLASGNRSDWAIALIEETLKVCKDDTGLLGKLDELQTTESSPMPLSGNFWDFAGNSVNNIRRVSNAKDLNGNLYGSDNILVYDESTTRGTHALYSLNSKYANLSGILALSEYYNGYETIMFRIVGDGVTLFEHRYRHSDGSVNSEPVEIKLDISGVDVLLVQFYGLNDRYSLNYFIITDYDLTISKALLVDFVVN